MIKASTIQVPHDSSYDGKGLSGDVGMKEMDKEQQSRVPHDCSIDGKGPGCDGCGLDMVEKGEMAMIVRGNDRNE